MPKRVFSSPVCACVQRAAQVPARGMNGVKSKLLSATRGLAVMSTTFAGYKPYAGDFGGRDRGNLLSFEQGTATPFAIAKTQARAVARAVAPSPAHVSHPTFPPWPTPCGSLLYACAIRAPISQRLVSLALALSRARSLSLSLSLFNHLLLSSIDRVWREQDRGAFFTSRGTRFTRTRLLVSTLRPETSRSTSAKPSS